MSRIRQKKSGGVSSQKKKSAVMRLLLCMESECSFRPTFDLQKRPLEGKKSIKIVENYRKIIEKCIKITKK
jgi:hypothetical protein